MNSVFRSLRVLAFAVFTLVLLAGVATHAQTFRGTILGSVSDSSGAAVPGATVTIKNLDTGLTRAVATQDDGSYSAQELPIGNYSVSVEKSGFKVGVVTGVKVEVSKESRVDVSLQPGQLAQTVEVQGEALPMVESTSNTLGGIVDSKVATSLPVNGRDYQKLIFLVPGVTGSPDQITDSPGSFGIFSVNGARGRANNFLLDGTDMNDGYRNDPAINEAGTYGTPATILPVEAIAELHVASNFEAQYGRSAGGVINVVTKSGTDNIHGSAFEFFRNDAMDARNYFNPTSQEQQPFHNNQFGAALGGPIIKDKTFFFVDYEGVRETGKLSYTTLVPTAQEISYATTNTPTATVNPVIANLLALNPWPTANIPSAVAQPFSGINNVFVATPFSNRVDNGIVKIDHNFNKDNLLTGRYYIGDSDQSFPLGLVGGSLLPGYNVTTPTRVQMIALSYVSVLSPSVVNEARLGWNRFAEGFFPEDRSFDPATDIGLDTGVGPYNFGLPRMNVGPYAQIGANYTVPRQRVDTNWHYIDGISWKHGKHDMKFGYEFRRTSISQILNIDFRGKLSFSGTPADGTPCSLTQLQTAFPNNPNVSPSVCEALSLFLAGTPTGGSIAQGNTNRNTFENSHAIYAQDSWRISHTFTLNLGLRYDYYGLIQDKQGNFTNVLLNPATQSGTAVLTGSGRLYQPDYKNVAPRVSVAWDVFGNQKTVVRAGYGIFYDAFSQDAFIGQVPYNSIFDPGSAYSGFGPNPIRFGSTISTSSFPVPFESGVPIYGFFGPMSDAFAVNPNLRTPYMQNFNLNLQQQVARRMVLQVGYVGSNGHKLLQTADANQPTQAQITAADLGCDCINDYGVPRQYTVPNVAVSPFYLNYLESSANSNYNSLQTSFRVDDWHGLTSTVNYTWSHSIDDASDLWEYITNGSTPNQTYTPNANKGNSNFDVRNRFTWNFIYQIPDSKDSKYKLIRNGWGVNGIVTVQSGQPFQFNFNFEDDFDGSGSGYGVPDRVPGVPIHYNQSDPSNYVNLDAFAVPCTPQATGFDGTAGSCVPGTRHYGNLGRNSLIGPHFRQFDFSIFKDTTLTERLKMQLRFEAYNLFNHPNFANPYLPFFIADPLVNGSTAAGTGVGNYALTSTPDVGIGYPFLGSGSPRNLQIAAKFTF
jgi:outer membrane receptor protein involved in Fe transport